MSQPQFSIVIPTRNRHADAALSALRTCLEQDHPDYEVVVCDNSDSPATRQSRGPVRLRPAARCESPRAARRGLTIITWRFHTPAGNMSIYIGDDDACAAPLPRPTDGIARARHPVQGVDLAGGALYSWPTFVEPEEANVLVVPSLREIESGGGEATPRGHPGPRGRPRFVAERLPRGGPPRNHRSGPPARRRACSTRLLR